MIQSLSVNINDAEKLSKPKPNLVRIVSPLLSPKLGNVRALSNIFDDKKALALAQTVEQEMKLKSAFPEKCQYSGYLSIRSASDAHWSQMYCVLSNNFLFGAETKYSTTLSVCIALEGCNTNLTTLSSDMTFEVNKHCFRAASPQLCKEWITNIEKASNLTIYDIYRFRYKLGSCASSNSKVMAAKHKVTNGEFAIKILNKHKCNDKSTLQREIQILKKLKSPYIVELCDLFETSKYLYIVMELCKGGELFDEIANMDYLNGDGYTEKDIHSIMHQLASGVQHMHAMGIVHRDLKPENILCVDANSIAKIKIADFGISAIVDPMQMNRSSTNGRSNGQKSKRISVCGSNINDVMLRTRVGTLSYTAPEILKYRPYDERVDYWSLGVIMYILVCGYPPFDADNDYALSDEIIHEEVEFDEEDWDHVDDGTRDLIQRLLDKNPRRRANCQDIIEHSWKIDVKTAVFQQVQKKLKQTVFKRKLQSRTLTRRNTNEYGDAISSGTRFTNSLQNLKERMDYLQEVGITSLDDSVLKQKRDSCIPINVVQFDSEQKENQIDAWKCGDTNAQRQSKTLEFLDLSNINSMEQIMIMNEDHLMVDSPCSPSYDLMSYSNRSSFSRSANGAADLMELLYPSTGTHSKQNSAQSVSLSQSRLSWISSQSVEKRKSFKSNGKRKKTCHKRYKGTTGFSSNINLAFVAEKDDDDVIDDSRAADRVRHKIEISDYDFDSNLNFDENNNYTFSLL